MNCENMTVLACRWYQLGKYKLQAPSELEAVAWMNALLRALSNYGCLASGGSSGLALRLRLLQMRDAKGVVTHKDMVKHKQALQGNVDAAVTSDKASQPDGGDTSAGAGAGVGAVAGAGARRCLPLQRLAC